MQNMMSGILFEMAVDDSFFLSFFLFFSFILSFFLCGIKYGHSVSVLECDLEWVLSYLCMDLAYGWSTYCMEHCKVYDRRW